VSLVGKKIFFERGGRIHIVFGPKYRPLHVDEQRLVFNLDYQMVGNRKFDKELYAEDTVVHKIVTVL
jgi:hypothetical protein